MYTQLCYMNTDPPVARVSKKPALRKLCAKLDLDQEKGEVINKAWQTIHDKQ